MTIDESWHAKYEEEQKHRIMVEVVLDRINVMLMQLSGNIAESQTKISEIDKKAGLISSQMAEKARQDSLVATVKEQERLDLFNLAKSNYDKGKFAPAINDFNDYIRKYPNADDAKMALFWMGEANFAIDSLETAKNIFKKYYAENKNEKMACSALYKLGLIFSKQGQEKNRDSMWSQLNKQCPESEEAKLVKENQKK
jgi:TolA-binding protein